MSCGRYRMCGRVVKTLASWFRGYRIRMPFWKALYTNTHCPHCLCVFPCLSVSVSVCSPHPPPPLCMCLSAPPPLCLCLSAPPHPLCVCVCVCVCLSVVACLSDCLSVFQSAYPSFSACLPVSPSVCFLVWMPVCRCSPVCLSTCLSVSVFRWALCLVFQMKGNPEVLCRRAHVKDPEAADNTCGGKVL